MIQTQDNPTALSNFMKATIGMFLFNFDIQKKRVRIPVELISITKKQ